MKKNFSTAVCGRCALSDVRDSPAKRENQADSGTGVRVAESRCGTEKVKRGNQHRSGGQQETNSTAAKIDPCRDGRVDPRCRRKPKQENEIGQELSCVSKIEKS
jgi:hypothetical protein